MNNSYHGEDFRFGSDYTPPPLKVEASTKLEPIKYEHNGQEIYDDSPGHAVGNLTDFHPNQNWLQIRSAWYKVSEISAIDLDESGGDYLLKLVISTKSVTERYGFKEAAVKDYYRVLRVMGLMQ